MSQEDSIDWTLIREKLPSDRSEESKKRRADLFDQFDPNGNGYLSLAEIDKGCRDVLGLYQLFDCKPVIMRAYEAARKVNNANTSPGNPGADYIERSEFRLLLLYLRQYLEIWQLFVQIKGDDGKVTYDEFMNAWPQIQSWGAAILDEYSDARAVFNAIDTNHGGSILFDEFADWALRRHLAKEDNEE